MAFGQIVLLADVRGQVEQRPILIDTTCRFRSEPPEQRIVRRSGCLALPLPRGPKARPFDSVSPLLPLEGIALPLPVSPQQRLDGPAGAPRLLNCRQVSRLGFLAGVRPGSVVPSIDAATALPTRQSNQ